MRRTLLLIWAGLILLGNAAAAHEFWIAPEAYQIAPGAPLRADLRVGQMFEGSPYPYFPDNFLRFEAGPVNALTDVPGRMGDMPALAVSAEVPGLWLVVHETTPRWLTYEDWERFELFTEQHDNLWARDMHRARGLPRSGFREIYFRHAKALVAVGDASAGADRRVGLPFEIVAETNPYTLSGGGTVVLRMFEGDRPSADAQMEVFQRLDGVVTRRALRSDAEGRVALNVPSGAQVLANFTTLTPVEGDPGAREAVWESHWASLSFAAP